jgi:ABC-type uncharacterized transport system ATPase subunit
MFKVIASRGAGKTTSLMRYANDLAYKYPDKMVLFVTQHPQLMVKKFLELTKERNLPQNLGFISYGYFLTKARGMKYIAVIDELDCWLDQFNIVGYTNTVGDDN